MQDDKSSLKRNLGIIGTLFLIGGLVAFYIVVQGRVDIRNRASELACTTQKMKCSWEFDKGLPGGLEVTYEYSVLGPCTNTTQFPCKGTTSEMSTIFLGASGGTFSCSVRPIIKSNGVECPTQSFSAQGTCSGDPETDLVPTVTDPSEDLFCGCDVDGGSLKCNPSEVNAYSSDSGAGLVELRPVFEEGTKSCYECVSMEVKDSSGRVIDTVNSCDKNEAVFRLHQAKATGTGAMCETYTVEAKGKNQTATKAQTCESCKHNVCCPKCVAPEMLKTEILDETTPNTLKTTMVDSCTSSCTFDVSFGASQQCGEANTPVEISVPDGSCINVDDEYAQNSELCDDDNDGTISYTYDRGGVYDISMRCEEKYEGGIISDDDEGKSFTSINGTDVVCRKRVVVACAQGASGGSEDAGDDISVSSDTSDFSAMPEDATQSGDIIPTGPSCKDLNVTMKCVGCE